MRYFAFLFKCTSAAISILTAATAQATAPKYKIESIGVLPGHDFSYAFGINNLGEVVGISGADSGERDGVMYRQSSLRSLNISLGGLYSVANDINDRGQVTGAASRPEEAVNPYLYSDGRVIDFSAPLHFNNGSGAAINESGHVVGYLGDFQRGFFYDGTTVHLLPAPFGGNPEARDLNDQDVIVGSYRDLPGGVTRPFSYKDGIFTILPISSDEGAAAAINNAGAVVGWTQYGGRLSATIWESGAVKEVIIPASDSSVAIDINAPGWVIGTFQSAIPGSHAFLYANGVTHSLEDLLLERNASRWQLDMAYSINDVGQIVGSGLFNGERRGFLATPVPETSTCVLMLAGVGIVGAVVRRRAASQR